LFSWLIILAPQFSYRKRSDRVQQRAHLVEQLSDNPAARMTAQEIAGRLKCAEQAGLVAAK
jgi:hypothetical protein